MVAHQEHAAPSLRAIRPDVSPALEAAYQKMMAKRPEDRPGSMSEVIALLQASRHATDNEAVKVAPPRKSQPELEVCKKTPLERAARRGRSSTRDLHPRDGGRSHQHDRELNLRDLVIDVRSDFVAARGARAVPDEREMTGDDH